MTLSCIVDHRASRRTTVKALIIRISSFPSFPSASVVGESVEFVIIAASGSSVGEDKGLEVIFDV